MQEVKKKEKKRGNSSKKRNVEKDRHVIPAEHHRISKNASRKEVENDFVYYI